MLAFLIPALLSTACSEVVKTTCYDAAVNKDEKATLTFYFSKNISLHERSIRIKHVVSDREENVLTCHWLTSLECDVRPTFSFDGVITDKISVVIPRVTESHVGKYVCFIVPSPPKSYTICSLTLKSETTPDTIMYLSTTVAEKTNVVKPDSQTWVEKDPHLFIALVNLGGIMCILGILVTKLIIGCIRRNQTSAPITDNGNKRASLCLSTSGTRHLAVPQV